MNSWVYDIYLYKFLIHKCIFIMHLYVIHKCIKISTYIFNVLICHLNINTFKDMYACMYFFLALSSKCLGSNFTSIIMNNPSIRGWLLIPFYSKQIRPPWRTATYNNLQGLYTQDIGIYLKGIPLLKLLNNNYFTG